MTTHTERLGFYVTVDHEGGDDGERDKAAVWLSRRDSETEWGFTAFYDDSMNPDNPIQLDIQQVDGDDSQSVSLPLLVVHEVLKAVSDEVADAIKIHAVEQVLTECGATEEFMLRVMHGLEMHGAFH